MKYKDLPNEKILRKLLATSFESPSANLKVFEWVDDIFKHVQFLENERVKLVRKYGKETKENSGDFRVLPENVHTFHEAFNKVLNMEIEKQIEKCPIEKEWFDDDKCQFSAEKEMWLSPAEIGKILSII